MRGLFLFSTFVIIYGSLFPFEFQHTEFQFFRLKKMFSMPLFAGNIPDILGNILLFIPFGFAGSELISRHGNRNSHYIYLFLFGFLFALSLQILQIYLPRYPALYDAVWNLVGIFAGHLLTNIIRSKYPVLIRSDERLALLALLSGWVLYQITPMIFMFDLALLKKNILLHLHPEHYSLNKILLFIFLWVTYSRLIDEISTSKRTLFSSLEFAVFALTIAKVFVYDNIVVPELFLGGLIAIAIMRSKIFDGQALHRIAALTIIPCMLYDSLYPFEFYVNPYKEFSWIPFSDLFARDMLPIVRVVFFKTFVYGSLLWNLYRGFPNVRWISLFCISYATIIEFLQFMTLSRSGSMTEPLLVLFLCTFIRRKQEVSTSADVKKIPSNL